MDLVTGTDIADVDVATPSALRGHSILNSPFRGGDDNSAERSQRPADLASDVHHGLSIVECTGTTGDVTDYGRKVFVDLAKLR